MDLSINARIRELRKIQGLTQEQLAEVLNLKRTTYARTEKEGNFSAEDIRQLSNFFDVDPYYILNGEENPRNFEISKSMEEQIREETERKIREEYAQKYPFLSRATNDDLRCFGLITIMKKSTRMHIFEYSYKIYRKEIKI